MNQLRKILVGLALILGTVGLWLIIFGIGHSYVERHQEEVKKTKIAQMITSWVPKLKPSTCYEVSDGMVFQLVSIDKTSGRYKGFLLWRETKDADLSSMGSEVFFSDIEDINKEVPCPTSK